MFKPRDVVTAQVVADRCGNCRFWLAPPPTAQHDRGSCRESPHCIEKLPGEWCGRHQRREAPNA